jgi:hypothetical protein
MVAPLVIPVLQKLRQEEIKASLGYTARPYLNKHQKIPV